MEAQDVRELYTALMQHGVRLWLDGGWGIDALLGQQTRSHKDLDALVAFADLPTMMTVLSQRGWRLKQVWSENRWVRHTKPVLLIGRGEAGEVATAFVLRDERGRELDFHVLHAGEDGGGTPAWEADLTFWPDDLSGQGVVAGMPVRCLSAAMQMRTHTGYTLQDKDLQDLRALHERFGVSYPEETARLPNQSER